MAKDEPYDMMPHRDIIELKKQLQKLKTEKFSSQELMNSMSALTKSMDSMLGLFKETAEELKVDDFYVLFYPRSSCSPLLIPHLEIANIKYLDYSTLFVDQQKDLWQPDGHPTAKANKIVAEKLTIELNITDFKEIN